MPNEVDYTTLGVTYACSILALLCITVRLLCRRIRGERFLAFRDDLWMGISIIPLLVRLGVIHIVLLYGTNSITGNPAKRARLTSEEITQRILGSQMVIVSRIGHPAFLWCMKACVLAFLGRLMSAEPKYARALRVTGWGLGLTFVGVILSNTLECRPFHKYYQVVPDPGNHCTKGFAQLLTVGTTNILTDLALIILPLPLIYKSHLPLYRKLQLSVLFGVGIFLIAITVARMPVISDAPGMQQNRTLWASIEILAACLVANAPILNNFIQEFRHKRARRKAHAHGPFSGGQEHEDTEAGINHHEEYSSDDTTLDLGGLKNSSDTTLKAPVGPIKKPKKSARRNGGSRETFSSACTPAAQGKIVEGNHAANCPYALMQGNNTSSPPSASDNGGFTLHTLKKPSSSSLSSSLSPCTCQNMVIQTSTSVIQTINNRDSLTVKKPEIHSTPTNPRYYKGDFLGTQVWADPTVFPGPKDPSQHVMYGMNFSHQSSHSGGFAHHTAEHYNKRRHCAAVMADVPGLGILPSAPPKALLNAISNAKRQAREKIMLAQSSGSGSTSPAEGKSAAAVPVQRPKIIIRHGRGESEESFKFGRAESPYSESYSSKETTYYDEHPDREVGLGSSLPAPSPAAQVRMGNRS
ncbi:hypothetical protein DFH27DRAFT_216521 [Peziza echinospora]|nr:hypothetical protein DFH27DRAFT_216521 [Peziza echinospora]